MEDLIGYSSIFKWHEEHAKTIDCSIIYHEFKSHPEFFNFIMAVGEGKYKSDPESIQMAVGINPSAAFTLIAKGPSKAGGDISVIDVVESRHILLLTFLKNYIGKESLGNVFEIGGGYGNFLRLASEIFEYNWWSIIDLEYICKLQRWFLEQEKVPLDNVTLYSNNNLPDSVPDTIIGTHSLSEFDFETFTNYYERYIKNSHRLFYASHNMFPSHELLKRKMDMILGDFKLISSKKYEYGQSTMYIFEK